MTKQSRDENSGTLCERAHAHTHAHIIQHLHARAHSTPLVPPNSGDPREMLVKFLISLPSNYRALNAPKPTTGPLSISYSEAQAKRSSLRAVSPHAQNIDKSAHDERSFSINQNLVSAETVDSEISHYAISDSIANSNTFHADSSDSHCINQTSSCRSDCANN